MARSVNKVIILGNLGADPEIRNTPNGAMVANFSVACTESWKDKDGQKHEKTEWVRCVAWRGTAEIIQRYVRKGDKVYVEGKLQTRDFEKNGEKRYVTEVIVSELVLAGGNGGNGGEHGFEDGPAHAAPADDSDLPF